MTALVKAASAGVRPAAQTELQKWKKSLESSKDEWGTASGAAENDTHEPNKNNFVWRNPQIQPLFELKAELYPLHLAITTWFAITRYGAAPTTRYWTWYHARFNDQSDWLHRMMPFSDAPPKISKSWIGEMQLSFIDCDCAIVDSPTTGASHNRPDSTNRGCTEKAFAEVTVAEWKTYSFVEYKKLTSNQPDFDRIVGMRSVAYFRISEDTMIVASSPVTNHFSILAKYYDSLNECLHGPQSPQFQSLLAWATSFPRFLDDCAEVSSSLGTWITAELHRALNYALPNSSRRVEDAFRLLPYRCLTHFPLVTPPDGPTEFDLRIVGSWADQHTDLIKCDAGADSFRVKASKNLLTLYVAAAVAALRRVQDEHCLKKEQSDDHDVRGHVERTKRSDAVNICLETVALGWPKGADSQAVGEYFFAKHGVPAGLILRSEQFRNHFALDQNVLKALAQRMILAERSDPHPMHNGKLVRSWTSDCQLSDARQLRFELTIPTVQ
jgi:hypothetical protein